ncbi:MAG: Putative pyruvate, phosphate dikinase regulatory protein [Thermoanaerobacterales bacterium 50_218]|nr:MAG: Putative pyruvate, phosphate dikinase regulatory protein [Thermoanaerobacterales bacterium 50_218]HAA89130.1 phosphoenolpyruvate synthase regulatory protein [Peptococcaceae bacterium]
MKTPVIYVVSDSLGETAEFVARAGASQFNAGKFEIRRVPYVCEKSTLAKIVEEASAFPSVIVYTLVIPGLREELEELARARNIPTVDVLGPMLDALAQVTDAAPKLQAGLLHRMDDDYFRRVEAIEFAVKYDDGKDPRGLLHADVVLIGVSRTSKTPVCMYLAHKRIKAANVPLVPEVAPPAELFKIPARRIVGLTIRPEVLTQVRQERLKALGLTTDAEYASLERIRKELAYADRIMAQLGCPVVDVTNKAVEETASRVLEIYYKGRHEH